MIKKINNFFSGKKLFKEMNMIIYFIDGSKVETDVVKYKTFQKQVKTRINGEEFREVKESDYKAVFDEMLEYIKDPDKCDYVSATINNKHYDFKTEKILEIELKIKY